MGEYKFGSSTRADYERSYKLADTANGGDLNRMNTGRGVPGPGTYEPGLTQTKSRDAEYSFGGKNVPRGNKHQTLSQGPGSYNIPGGIGVQLASNNTSAPEYGFGTGTRDKNEKVQAPGLKNGTILSPGPGRYDAQSSLAQQVVSTKPSNTGPKFGSDERKDLAAKSAVPGPGQYNGYSSLETQVFSENKTCASTKFGTSSRPSMQVPIG